MPDEETPQVDMAMSPEEFAELRASVAAVSQQDFHLGRVLELLVLHLGHAHGLDPAQEDARRSAEAEAKAAEEEKATAAAAPAEEAPAPAEESAPVAEESAQAEEPSA